MDLSQEFIALARKFSNDENKIAACWNEIHAAYSSPGRHYHTLQHLENLSLQLSEARSLISDRDAVLFMLFYHDAVYSATSRDNEERSADLAQKRMRELGVKDELIVRVHEGILATKSHEISPSEDINLFTDADLSILGSDAATYALYAQQVRKEYSIFPDLLYKPGRRKVLEHFLKMERIFKTDFFWGKYEEQARGNLKTELSLL